MAYYMDHHPTLKKTYWLVLCILLLYQEPAGTALALQRNLVSGKVTDPIDPIDPQCSDWEEFDGTECVCASDVNRCSDQGGVVCDNNGVQYQSSCFFAQAICQEKIPVERTLQSCGACEHLRLVNGNGQVIATFSREGTDLGWQTEYLSDAKADLSLFYVEEIEAWAVGIKTWNETFVAMRLIQNAAYPQDHSGGMLVAKKNGTDVEWEVEPFFRFECVQGVNESERPKRLFFIILAVVTLAVTVTTTTLKIVQAKKGCLYYPSVCSLRDRIRDHLKPEVTGLRDRFISTYGDPEKFKQTVDTIHDQIMDIREKITTVKELHTELKLSLANITELYSSIQDEFPEFKSSLDNYNKWVDNLNTVAGINLLMLPLEIVMTLPSLLASTVSTFAVAAAGIGAALAVGFAIVDIISSVNEERKARDELQAAEAKYIKARNDLNSAFRNVEAFQQEFCIHVIAFLRNLSEKGNSYHTTFSSLYTFLSNTFGTSVSHCNNKSSESDLATLTMLSQDHLLSLINFLKKDIESLQEKIVEVQESNAFIAQIHGMIKSDVESPETVFKLVKLSRPKLMKNTFGCLFELLKYISVQILPQTLCYWGYNLDKIRQGEATKENYFKAPVCKSKEIQKYVDLIEQGVEKGFAPCKIFRQIKGPVFKSRYSVVRFIADNVLQSSLCYWGYDLSGVRTTSDAIEVDKASVNSGLFVTLGYFKSASIGPNQLSSAETIMCKQHGICSSTWQTFILCQVWHDHSVDALGCPVSTSTDTNCVPSTEQYESCE